jgi:hypothetical protein
MIFNPTRGGGSEKEYTISVRNSITVSATKLKPGRVFEAKCIQSRSPKMRFTDPDTGKTITMAGGTGHGYFVMPCANVELTA